MLNNTGPRGLAVGIVHCGIALEIGLVQKFRLKADRTVLQRTQLIIEIRIDGTGVNHLVRHGVILRLLLQIILTQTDLNALQHIGHHLGVAAHGDTLEQSVKIVIVKGQAHRQSPDNEARKLRAGTSPLLLGVALHQLLIDIRTYKADSLLLQILRLCDSCRLLLLLNLGGRFLRRHHAPHLIEGVHIKGQRIQFSVIIRHRGIRKPVKLREAIHILPHLTVIRMEDMGSILMHMDAFAVLRINIACNVRTTVNHKNTLARCLRLMGKHRAV